MNRPKRLIALTLAIMLVMALGGSGVAHAPTYATDYPGPPPELGFDKARNGNSLVVHDKRGVIGFNLHRSVEYWNQAAQWQLFTTSSEKPADVEIREANGECGGAAACAPHSLSPQQSPPCMIYINKEAGVSLSWATLAHEMGHCLGMHHPEESNRYRGVMRQSYLSKYSIVEDDRVALQKGGYPVQPSIADTDT